MPSFRDAFATVVRRRRHKLKFSQEELAERADIHRVYLSRVETGKVSPSMEIARRVSKGLGTELSKLVREAEEN